MTRDDVIRMAREAGIITNSPYLMPHDRELHGIERFATLAFAAGVAAEREECAKVCDQIADDRERHHGAHFRLTADESAAAIRARGQS